LQYGAGTQDATSRWLDTTTNAPPGVALPKVGTDVRFVRWVTPLDPAGSRWLCFDRTRRSGPHNRVWFDSNGNGRLDDETPVDARNVDSYSAYFDSLRFVFKGEDGPIVYHLGLRFIRYNADDIRVIALSGCRYGGLVDFGGTKRQVRLVDANVNGTFNDRSTDPTAADRIVVANDKSTAKAANPDGDEDESDGRFLGRYLELGDRLFEIEVARDGAFVKVQPARDVVTGTVRVQDKLTQVVVVGEVGQFVRKPVRGEFLLPVGRYRISQWTTDRKDDKGAAWKLEGTGLSPLAEFEVAAAQPVPVDVGEPILASLSATERKGMVTFGLRLTDRLGESVEITRGGQRPRAPKLQLEGMGSTFRVTNSFEYG
jgi:hypothetical protein